MSVIDKVIAAVTPPESAEARAKARAEARASAMPGGWFEAILDHHLEIEACIAKVFAADTAEKRREAQKRLAFVLTGHSTAEESVIYPALALHGEKAHAEMAYVEQSATKVQIAALEDLDPLGKDYIDKLEHIRGALAHHVYEEEGSRFMKLNEKADAPLQARLTQRYREEFERYTGSRMPQSASEVPR